MTHFGIESFADMLGGGGDLHMDRLPIDWARFTGAEMEDGEVLEMESPETKSHIDVL
jgi:hypothetical protein